MNTLRCLLAIALLAFGSFATAADGLISVKSPHNAKDTMSQLEKVVKEHGFSVFAMIDHAAGAATVGMTLRPTELLIFGNPKGGTPLIECAQTAGIDLPLKALVWEDSTSQVWVSYNDPAYIAQRHGVPQCPVVEKMSKVLADIAKSSVAQ